MPSKNSIPQAFERKIKEHLKKIYPQEQLDQVYALFETLIKSHLKKNRIDVLKNLKYDPRERTSEKDIMLVTYADSIRSKPGKHLQALNKFATKYLKGHLKTIHLLPFYPYSSDRGFSVKDYFKVNPPAGDWKDVRDLGKNFKLMFDFVLNHASVQGVWFQKFIKGDPEYRNFFLHYKKPDAISKPDLKKILRPRTSDLLTKFEAKNGPVYVWTTFSADQADLNYQNPKVLLAMTRVMLFYLEQEADVLRMDAVTYAWKELSTDCAHRPQAHEIVKLFRTILDLVKPDAVIITETNVPHQDNITYFADGMSEAQMVYNFTLPPLTMHTFLTGDASKLAAWAKTLKKPSPITAYFNFLDSHDGIGVLGAKNILSEKEINNLVETTKKYGGLISYRTSNGGAPIPYELNITWFSAMNPKDQDPMQVKVARYLASRAVALSLRGVPMIYLLGFFGAGNDKAYALKTKINRNINRRNFTEQDIYSTFNSKGWSRFRTISLALLNLIDIRKQEKAFSPAGRQEIIAQNKGIFSLIRTSADKKENILALINVSSKPQTFEFNLAQYAPQAPELKELISRKFLMTDSRKSISLPLDPYAIQWWKY